MSRRQHGSCRAAKFAVNNLSNFLAVDALQQRLADVDIVEGFDRGVEQQVTNLRGFEGFKGQAFGGTHHIHQGRRNIAHDVDLTGLQLHQTRIVILNSLELDVLSLYLVRIAVVGVLLQQHIVAVIPLLEHIGAGSDGMHNILFLGHGLGIGLAAQHHVEAGQLGKERAVGLGQGDYHLAVRSFHGIDGLCNEAILAGFGIARAVQAPYPVFALHRRAIGEHHAGDKIKGVGQAVIADRPIRRQQRLDGHAVAAHAHKAFLNLFNHMNLGTADSRSIGLEIGRLRAAEYDGVLFCIRKSGYRHTQQAQDRK